MSNKEIDLLIHTPGGQVDAVEKIVTVLRQRTKNYRVIVPSWAKSGGTLIALSSSTILLGVNSELGPIDPQMMIPQFGPVPAEFVAEDDSQPPVIRKIASTSVERAKTLALRYLSDGMLHGKSPGDIEQVVLKISSATSYGSHGAVIDYSEAKEMGLSVEWVGPESTLWRRIWLLYCMYDYDIGTKSIGKFFEGTLYSIARQPMRFDA